MAPTTASLSQFFSEVFTAPDYFTKEQWAVALGVEVDAIDLWIAGEAIPKPRQLRSLLDILELTRRVPPTWATLLPENLASVTECEFIWDLPWYPMNVQDYLVLPVLEGFLGQLQTLGPEAQTEVLQAACEHIFRIRDGK